MDFALADESNDKPTDSTKSSFAADKLTLAMMLLAAGVAIIGFGLFFSAWWGGGAIGNLDALRLASREHIDGNLVTAGELAKTVELDPEIEENKEWLQLKDFLVGSGDIAKANQSIDDHQRRAALFDAVPKLQEASEVGFPPGREVQGMRLLGETFVQLGRYKDATKYLRGAIDRDPTQRRELLPILAESHLRAAQANPNQALALMDVYLQDSSLQLERRRQGELIRIKALTRLDRYKEIDSAIDTALAEVKAADLSIQAKSGDFLDRLKLARAIAQIEKTIGRYGARPIAQNEDRSTAMAELGSSISDLADLTREAVPSVAARARLWSGRAYRCQGQPEQALSEMTTVRQRRPFGGEAILGGIEELDILSRQGRGDEMLQTVRYMMREIGEEKEFDPTMISFSEFKRRLLESIDRLRDLGHFEAAIDIARTLPPLFAPSTALMQEGIAFRQWAAVTLEDGKNLNGEVSRGASVLARKRFRAAGDAFAQSAELDFDTPRYISTQWSAIDSYQRGRHFRRSIRLLEPYLRYEDRGRRPRGLVALGRALLAENEPEKAIDSFESCIVEFPRDPLRYDARLLSALAHSEIGDLEKSRTLLVDNLQDGNLTPESPAWRDSLFSLADILYRKCYENHLLATHADEDKRSDLLKENQPLLERTMRRLDESVERYWPDPRAESSAYLLARTHVLASEWPKVEAQSPDILDAARRSLRVKIDTELKDALNGFARLKQHLLDREETDRLSAGAETMLLNCFLAEADTLRELGMLEDAATAYRAMSLRYMNEPPALEAILGQARCVRDLGRVREADLLIRQAAIVLERIPDHYDEEFEKITRYNRDGWQQLLTWMNAGIKEPVG